MERDKIIEVSKETPIKNDAATKALLVKLGFKQHQDWQLYRDNIYLCLEGDRGFRCYILSDGWDRHLNGDFNHNASIGLEIDDCNNVAVLFDRKTIYDLLLIYQVAHNNSLPNISILG